MTDDRGQIFPNPNPNLNLMIRTWVPRAETRDLKICPPANHPVSGFPLLVSLPNR